MSSNQLAFGVLGLACMAAAAGGGYLATRQNSVPAPVAAQTAAGTPIAASGVSTPAAAPSRPVQETEAIVGDSKGSTPTAKPASRAIRRKWKTAWTLASRATFASAIALRFLPARALSDRCHSSSAAAN